MNKRYGCDFILIINGSVLHFRQFKLIYKQMTLIFLYLFGALAVSFLCSVLEAVLLSTPISFISMKEAQGGENR